MLLRRSSCTLLLFAQLLCTYLYAQQLLPATPESVGMSGDRLKRIEKVLNSYIEKQQIAGAVALVARNGKIVYHQSFGYDDIAKKSPLKKDAIVRIASQTKAITSAAVMMLYEEGHFLLDDPISKYLPSFANPQVIETFNEKDTTYTTRAAKREITIRDLLTHTSGIGYAVIGSREAAAIYAKHNIPVGLENPTTNLAEVMDRLGKLPIFHDPGTKHLYGLNTDVLGYLVEKISGQTLADFFYERLFKPLAMNDTYFYLPPSKHVRLATLYTEDRDKKTIKTAGNRALGATEGDLLENFPRAKGTYYSGGGGLSSTALDYAHFLQMLLNGGRYRGQQLLSPTTVRLFTSNQLAGLKEGKTNFSLGFGITTKEQAARYPMSEGTFDWGGAFGTQYWVDPVEGLVGVILTQKQPSSWGGEISAKFKASVYQAIIKSNRKPIE
jgi:CubicO group peptidase (beta-lactamase class C family)